VWHPRKLEIQLQYLQEHPEVDLVGTSSFDDPARIWPALLDPTSLPAQRLVLENIVLRPPFPTSTVVVRKRCFDAIGYFDTTLRNAEDRDMYIRIGDRYSMVKLDTVLVWGGRDGEHLSMGSATAEQSTYKMIIGAFNRIDALRGRFFLKQRALSFAAFEASYMYLAKGQRLRALHRVFRSFLLWPFPYPRNATRPFARVKRLFRILFPVGARN
jgi:hypothetical protein